MNDLLLIPLNPDIQPIFNSNINLSTRNSNISPFIFSDFSRSPFKMVKNNKIEPFIYSSKYYMNDFSENQNIINFFDIPNSNHKFPEFGTPELISNSFNELRKNGIAWKSETQKFRINQCKEIFNLVKRLDNGKYHPDPPKMFITHERGRERQIKSNSITDKIIQKSFCKNKLTPYLIKNIIYDNTASLKNRGISLSRKRFEIHFREAYNKYNGNAYILFIDFSKYFDNISHEGFLNLLSPILNEDEIKYLRTTMKEFEINYSFLSDEDFESIYNKPFNALEYYQYIKDNNIDLLKIEKDTKKKLKKSFGIGNEISQVAGVLFPKEIDNYCKIVRGIKYYGRYMDDTYIISNSKEELLDILENINLIARKLGIFINEKKTHINKISSHLSFLKIKYHYDKQKHKLIRIPVNNTFKRAKIRIKKLYKKTLDKTVSIEDFINCYRSWRGSYKKFDCGYKIKQLDDYCYNLIKDSIPSKLYLINKKEYIRKQKEIEKEKNKLLSKKKKKRKKKYYFKSKYKNSKFLDQAQKQ